MALFSLVNRTHLDETSCRIAPLLKMLLSVLLLDFEGKAGAKDALCGPMDGQYLPA